MLPLRLPAQTSLPVPPAPSLHPALPIVSGLAPTTAMLGACVSTTFTVRVLVSEWPCRSLTVYMRGNIATVFASTHPDPTRPLVRFAAQRCLAVAAVAANGPRQSAVTGFA